MQGTITAYVQHCNMLMCSVEALAPLQYLAGVKKDQIPDDAAKLEAKAAIAKWRDAVLDRPGFNASRWGRAAGIDPSVIRRNMDPDHSSVTTIQNLHALARAASIPSVLDFLSQQADGAAREGSASRWTPRPATLAHLTEFLWRSSPASRSRAPDVQWFAHGLAAGLEFLALDPTREDSPDYLAGAESAILIALRNYKPQPEQAA